MNFLLEQIIYFIINFILNPVRFFKRLNNIKILPFGRDVSKIEIISGKIFKYYRSKDKYYKNLNYYHIMKKYDFVPKNLYINEDNYLIVQEFKGNLLKVSDLSNNIIKNDLIRIFDKLEENNIIVPDIYPLFFNKNVINNLTLMNNKIFLIDYGSILIVSSIECEIFYTRLKKYYNLI